MENKHVKIFSTSLLTKEIQIYNVLLLHIYKNDWNKNIADNSAGENVEQLELSNTAMQNRTTAFKEFGSFF